MLVNPALLPWNTLAFAEKSAGGAVIRQGGQPHGCIGALLGGQRGLLTAHIRFDPTGTGRVDQDIQTYLLFYEPDPDPPYSGETKMTRAKTPRRKDFETGGLAP